MLKENYPLIEKGFLNRNSEINLYLFLLKGLELVTQPNIWMEYAIKIDIMVVNVGKIKNIAVSEGLEVSLCNSCSARYIRKYTLFRKTDLPDADPVTSSEHDEVAQEQYTS